jgi:5-methyltetrahydrofolate--homocysteine methyltransferase
LGITTFDAVPLEKIIEFIDWTPFFQTWELHGKFPAILTDEVVGETASKLFEEAQEMLNTIVSEKWLTANGVVGIWPANSIDDDIEIYDSISKEKIAVQHSLRQQLKKSAKADNTALSDFIAPKETGIQDYVGGFAVTTGLGIEPHLERFEKDHDDYNSILLKALADRLAEAFAEYLHLVVRKETWGYASDESLNNDELIKETYKGIRPAPGYPACPDHTEKITLFKLLDAQNLAGVSLTDSVAMMPASSVSGWYFAHPKSKYFGVGKITEEQVKDIAERKGIEYSKMERWLSSSML